MEQTNSLSSDNYYVNLGVSKNADQNAIKNAYRKLAILWHPDKNLDNQEEAKKKFLIISEAYSVLSNREKRIAYDNSGKGEQVPNDACRFKFKAPTYNFSYDYTDNQYNKFDSQGKSKANRKIFDFEDDVDSQKKSQANKNIFDFEEKKQGYFDNQNKSDSFTRFLSNNVKSRSKSFFDTPKSRKMPE